MPCADIYTEGYEPLDPPPSTVGPANERQIMSGSLGAAIGGGSYVNFGTCVDTLEITIEGDQAKWRQGLCVGGCPYGTTYYMSGWVTYWARVSDVC
jgi:hypothetical protein